MPVLILGKREPLPRQLSRVHVRVAQRQIVELHALIVSAETEGIRFALPNRLLIHGCLLDCWRGGPHVKWVLAKALRNVVSLRVVRIRWGILEVLI